MPTSGERLPQGRERKMVWGGQEMKLMWPVVHLVKDKCLLHYSPYFYRYWPHFKNFKLFKKCSGFHFWSGSVRSSTELLKKQDCCKSSKKSFKGSGNCAKGTRQRKKRLFKKIS